MQSFVGRNTAVGCLLFSAALHNYLFFNPANLLVLMSITTSEIVQGSRASDIAGMGKMILPWKYGAYLPTLSLSYFFELFSRTFQEAGVALSAGFCPGGIGLVKGIDFWVYEEPGRADQLALSLLAAHSSDLDGKAYLVVLRHSATHRRIWGDPQKDLRIVGGIEEGVTYWWVLNGCERQPGRESTILMIMLNPN